MKQILAPNKLVNTVLGFQKKTKDGPCRLLSFCYRVRVSEGILLYNNMTKELLLLDPDEADTLPAREELFRRWFLVPEDFNESQALDSISSLSRQMYAQSKHGSSYVILPTTGCNARCFYCFEKGIETVDMTEETALAVSDFICRNTPDRKAKLKWFGGEPLFRMAPIDLICRRLKDSGIAFTSSITTNGFLLTPDILGKAKELWNTENVQITLDGTAAVYNRVKNYIYPDIDAFQTVLRNVEALSSSGISLQIRLNIDKHNFEDLSALIRCLSETLKDKSRVFVYLAPLYEQDSGFRNNRTDEERIALFDRISELETLIRLEGFPPAPRNHVITYRCFSCCADNPYSVVISPDGRLYRCEHIHSCSPVGSVFNPDDSTSSGKWDEYCPLDSEECNSCPMKPSCSRVLQCPEVKDCFPVLRKYREKQLEEEILTAYNKSISQN